MKCWHCQSDVPFDPTHCLSYTPVLFHRELVSPVLSTLDLSNCRRCHQRKPLPVTFESGSISLRVCDECAQILQSLNRVQKGRSASAY